MYSIDHKVSNDLVVNSMFYEGSWKCTLECSWKCTLECSWKWTLENVL